MIIGWDPNKVKVLVVHMNKQVTHCFVETVVDKSTFYCSFVYASNYGIQSRRLWSDLSRHKALAGRFPWVILGDFNVTLKFEEHSDGGAFMSDEMIEFQNCINDIEVEDLCNTGFNFTWTKSLKNPNCDVLKKLDRVLVNEEFINTFSNAHAIFQPFSISDHSPALLNIPNGLVHKSKSFRFMNFVADKAEFLPLVENGWKKEVNGCAMFCVVKKLKALKKDLNKLNWQHGNIFTNVEVLKRKLKDCQAKVDTFPHDTEIKAAAVQVLNDYTQACKDELKILKQKVRLKWLEDGDKNTKFFHGILKARKSKSRIESICNEHGQRFFGDKVADQFVSHFQNFFGKASNVQPHDDIGDIFTNTLSVEDANEMVTDVTNDEIKEAIFDIDSNKASGPDGFTAGFFQKSLVYYR
ncbi:uncharacterized protein [Rutidosis leptorrhynchoides]|uniref:uncharacterized protein n=1 Tax=Rutidosis leptorrhynchoides TaxID=125765 RepID=UPI003A9A5208